MFDVVGFDITLTRGDSFACEVGMMRGKTAYVPQEGDSVRFALKRKMFTPDKGNYIDQKPLVVKAIPTDTLILRLEPEDTKNLRFAVYAYDIEITFSDGSVDTFIKGDFEVTPEVD